jgi:hypothetical protein
MIRIAAFLLFFAPFDFVDSLAESGRMVGLVDSPSERFRPHTLIAPGAPPVLTFRYFDASDRGRFGNLGLMTDDAGH